MTPNRQASEKVHQRLEAWKRQLIDLTRRNQLLNYKARRRATIDVVDEVPQVVLRDLLDGKYFYFDPRPETPDNETSEEEAPPIGRAWPVEDLGMQEPSPSLDPTRDYTGGIRIRRTTDADLPEYHRDDRLQTKHTESNLEKKLLHIYRTAESSMEEQGVNTLYVALGMLEWYESKTSDQVDRAPIVLVPAWLGRVNASSPFTLARGDDEPILNPAIVEKLRLDFGLHLPELPELSDDLNVEEFFFAVEGAVSGFQRWRVTSDIALGLFDFRKFVMYRDLERYPDQFTAHDLIQSMCGESETPVNSAVPADVMKADLDKEMSPWDTIQVVEADSSQQRAMLAIRKGHHLVIEGPPGTGKSQTITNVIADSLAKGKSVLFVSEKMAALEVVKVRLEAVGLSEFCLELHSHHTKKTEFVRELARTLDVSRQEVSEDGSELRRLERLTRSLRKYVEALHDPCPPLLFSPFEAIARLTQLSGAAILNADIPGIKTTNRDTFNRALENLEDLSRALDQVGDPSVHPLRGSHATDGTPGARRTLHEAAESAVLAMEGLLDRADEFTENLGLRFPETFGDVGIALEAAAVLADSPGADRSVLENPQWNQLSADVKELIEVGRAYARLRSVADERFRPSFFERDLGEEIEALANHSRSALRVFKPGYWRIRRVLKSYTAESYRIPNLAEFVRHLSEAARCRSNLLQIRAVEGSGRALFADRWLAENSDWDGLDAFAHWVVDLRQYVLKEIIAARGYDLAAGGSLVPDRVEKASRALNAHLEKARAAIQELIDIGRFESEAELGTGADTYLASTLERTTEIANGARLLRVWTLYRLSLERCEQDPSAHFVRRALVEHVEARELRPAFERAFLERWLEAVCAERQPLGEFQAIQHEARIEEFQDLDRVSHEIARRRVRSGLFERRSRELLRSELSGQLQLVQREAKKKSRILPIRKLLRHAPDVVKLIKPCFMMSPLSTAWYLDPDKLRFDLLVFDEASQIPPADAVGSMIRAKQVVVVGDSRQLPPTNFFSAQIDESEATDDIEYLVLDDLESVLDEVASSGVPRLRLKWHYRSEHESLIRFSNEEYYADDPLYTFPSADRDRSSNGLQFVYVEDGIYEGRGMNSVEARRVADAVVEHISEHPDWTLGVGTFGMAQQNRILDELDERRRIQPEIEFFFQQEGEAKFFVKNLENIQGDDRDVIFISVTYGPDVDGRVRRNFGPINAQGGWRRLNVITTRAKKRLIVFSSMRADDIDVTGIAPGARDLHRYLKYAETGIYPTATVVGGEPESPFEIAVIDALQQRGYRTVSQVGECGYRVDIGVLDQEFPGRFACGIECDGRSYHGALTVRDRDRLRQLVLEDRGWDIHRVWSTDWFYDQRGQVGRLVGLIEESRERLRTGTSRSSQTRRLTTAPVTQPVEVDPPDGAPGEQIPLEDIPVEPYRFAPTLAGRDPDQFYETPIQRLVDDCRHVLDVESPIHRAELARRVADYWGFARVGSKIERYVYHAIDHLSKIGQAQIRADGFVWKPEMTTPPVRSRAIDGAHFNSDHISAEEVAEAVKLLLTYRAPLLPDEIPSEVVRILGFKRSGRILRGLVADAVEKLVEDGVLEPGGLGIRLRKRSSGQVARSDETHGAAPMKQVPKQPTSAQKEDVSTQRQPASSAAERPYISSRISDLEELVSSRPNDHELLSRVAYELSFRTSERAKRLALRVAGASSLRQRKQDAMRRSSSAAYSRQDLQRDRDYIENLPGRDLLELAHWAKVAGHLRGWQRGVLYSVGMARLKGGTLSDKQIRRAAEAYREGISLGFRPTRDD